MTTADAPLRLSPDRIIVYGALLVLVTSLPFIVIPHWFYIAAYNGDIANYWAAGSTVGTAALLSPSLHAAWETAHHVGIEPFVYPPAFAWLYAPLHMLSPLQALVVEETAMFAIFAAAGFALSAAYGFPRWFGVAGVLAWSPTVNGIEVGQNTGIALLLFAVALYGLNNNRVWLPGLACGLLLYKPTDALPLLLVFAMRRHWKALAIACAFGAVWYLVSVPASNGDWLWPAQYLQTVRTWYAADFQANTYKAVTIPTLLLALGAPYAAAVVAAVLVLVAELPLLARLPVVEATSMSAYIGTAASLHAWPYELPMLLPGFFFAMTSIREPWRTPIIVGAYVIAALAGNVRHGNYALAIFCVGGALFWLSSGYRRKPAQV